MNIIPSFFNNKKRKITELNDEISRDRLITDSRILFIDDETPELIDELKRQRYVVEHDKTGDEIDLYISQLHDIVILDYYGVGRRLSGIGGEEGLGVLKFIKNVSPRTRLIAYTSRSLSANEADFYRLAHDVLPKDATLRESLEIVESQLRKAHSKQFLLDALLTRIGATDEKTRSEIEDAVVKAIEKKDGSILNAAVSKFIESAGKGSAGAIISIFAKKFGL